MKIRTLFKSNKNPKLNNWVSKKSKGKEKQYIIYMLLISFLLMGVVIAQYLTHKEETLPPLDITIKTSAAEAVSKNKVDFMENYQQYNNDLELQKLLVRYQSLLHQVPLDTIAILNIEDELKKHMNHE